jgi:hypothetical protein
MAIGKLKLATSLKHTLGPIQKLKPPKKSYELRLIRPQTQHKNPGHMYLKFITPLTPYMEKIVKYHGFNLYRSGSVHKDLNRKFI